MNCKGGKGHDILKCEMGGKKGRRRRPAFGKSQTQARLVLMCEVGRGCSYREAYGGMAEPILLTSLHPYYYIDDTLLGPNSTAPKQCFTANDP